MSINKVSKQLVFNYIIKTFKLINIFVWVLIALILLIPLIYSYILYTIKNICYTTINTGIDTLIIYQLEPKEELSIWKYFTLKAHDIIQNISNIKTLFTEEYLLKDNLSTYQFGWTQKYLDEHREVFKEMSDQDIMRDFLNKYLGLHQTYILMYLYYLRIETYREVQLYIVRLCIFTVFLIDWVYILLYGLN